MTTLREAAQQALEALEQDNPGGRSATITALRAALAQPDRAQRMRDAGYTRRPTLREMAEDEQEQEAIAQNLQSRLDAAFLLEERRQEIAQPRRETEPEPSVRIKCTVVDNQHPSGVPFEQWVNAPRRETEQMLEHAYKSACDIVEEQDKKLAELEAVNRELLGALVSFTKSGYIKKQHPKRYAAAVAAIAKAEAQL